MEPTLDSLQDRIKDLERRLEIMAREITISSARDYIDDRLCLSLLATHPDPTALGKQWLSLVRREVREADFTLANMPWAKTYKPHSEDYVRMVKDRFDFWHGMLGLDEN